MYELNIEATIDNLEYVTAFLDEIMEEHELPVKARVQLDVAVEEIYVNIAHYAYTDGTGSAKISVTFPDPRTISICFVDQGQPYDPLQKPDPDITLSANERPIGGLGIYMVKKSMDDMNYVYENGCNTLTITKKFGSGK